MTLPLDFQRMMTKQFGKEEYDKLAEALAMPAPTSIRVNKEKDFLPSMLNVPHSPIPWCTEGFYLDKRPAFTSDPLFHAGCYYVQEASSMFLAHILRHYVEEPAVALDLCAAPGGKSTLMLSQLPAGSVLIANEAMRQRANILAENITKWGNPNCIVTNNYAEDFGTFSQTFDVIVCDAPCSGEGMFRKDPDSISEWSLDNVDTCWQRQRDIVSNIWHTLKDGGLFIYSTCTYNSLEDEENVAWIAKTLGAEVLSCHPQEDWSLTETNTHFYPHRTKGEGFFISVLRKTASAEDNDDLRHRKHKEKRRNGKPNTKIPAELKSWMTNSEDFTITEDEEAFRAFPTAYLPLYQQAKSQLKVVHAGIELATVKGKNLQPCHSLAMSNHLHPEAFPSVEVEKAQAIAYLHTETLQLPDGTPRGYVLLTYQGHSLGFVKNIGNRANNLYPAEWRIRSGYIQ